MGAHKTRLGDLEELGDPYQPRHLLPKNNGQHQLDSIPPVPGQAQLDGVSTTRTMTRLGATGAPQGIPHQMQDPAGDGAFPQDADPKPSHLIPKN